MIRRRSSLILSLLLGWSSVNAKAQDVDEPSPEWWFDVEVVVFDRGVKLTDIAEQFEFSSDFSPATTDIDLITAARKPNIDWVYQNLQPCEPTLPPSLDPVPLPPLELPAHIIEIATAPLVSAEDLSNEGPLVRKILQSQFDDIIPKIEVEDEVETDTSSPSATWIAFHAPEFESNADAYYIPEFELGCHRKFNQYNTKAFAVEDVLPVYPFGASRDQTWGEHILAKEDLALNDLSLRIRSERGLTRLMHVAWRQQVKFGKENASTFRVYGGKNYGLAFDENGTFKAPTSEISDIDVIQDPLFDFDTFASVTEQEQSNVANLFEQRLGTAIDTAPTEMTVKEKDINEIWQFDGNIKVFLQYVGRVPYLFIDGDIGYRQPFSLDPLDPTKQVLVSIPYKQQRRVISTQLHYFDHPMFGMLIEIRRYKVP